MKKVLRVSLIFSIVLAILLASSCTLRTQLSIDQSFKGQRLMVLTVTEDEYKKLTLGDSITDIDSFKTMLSKECPESIQVESVAAVAGGYAINFVIPFTSIEDYRSKVSGILGREPSIEYKTDSNLFYPRYILKEDFTSAELLAWGSKKLVESGAISEANITDAVQTEASLKLGEDIHKTENPAKPLDIDVINANEIYSITINTTIINQEQYQRSVGYNIPITTVNKLGADKILEFVKSFAPDGSTTEWEPDVVYERSRQFKVIKISFAADIKELGRKTGAALNQNAIISYYSPEVAQTDEFRTSGQLSESFLFTEWPMNKDRSSQVKLIYTTANGTKFTEAQGGTISADGKTVLFEKAGATELDVSLKTYGEYKLKDISLKVVQKGADEFTKTAVFTFDDVDTDSGANHLKSRLLLNTEEAVEYSISKDMNGYSQLAVSASGSADEVDKALHEVFVDKNSFNVYTKKSIFLKNSTVIADNVDFTRIFKKSGYTGSVLYSFVPVSGEDVSGVTLKSASGGVLQKLGAGKKSKEINLSTTEAAFTVDYTAKTTNWIFVLVLIGIGVLLILIAALYIFIKVKQSKNPDKPPKKKKEKTPKKPKPEPAVKSSVEAEDNRSYTNEVTPMKSSKSSTVLVPYDENAIVVEAEYDDGLNEVGDESEGSWLFVNTIRALSIFSFILFLCPLAKLTFERIILDKNVNISGWKLFFGSKINMIIGGSLSFNGDAKSALLFAIPALILLILALRKYITPIMAYIFTGVLALSQLIYLISVPAYIKSLVSGLSESGSSKKITYDMSWGFYLSELIFLLIAAGVILVLFLEFGRLKRVREAQHTPKAEPAPVQPEPAPVYEAEEDTDTSYSEEAYSQHTEPEPFFMQPEATDEPNPLLLFAADGEAIAEEHFRAKDREEKPVFEALEPEPEPTLKPEITAEPAIEDIILPLFLQEEVTAEAAPAQAAPIQEQPAKPKRRLLLPSQEDFDENSGY
ncbi:MAG: hypothetical protein LBS74_03810 [Oscillospiraceae bacterium]|jgi:large-conductance mechanosensitive channel|nr:hypothetical protein [Oscillospiraceae bacterium]